MGVRLRHSVYEYAADPTYPAAQADAYRAYLERRPDQTLRAEIELLIARCYYVVQEILTVEPPDTGAITAADLDRYRANAQAIYERLSQSSDPSVASRATVMLFNLREGRRIYINPNAW